MFSETFEEAWRLRYGTPAPEAHPSVEPFLRHRSVRRFEDRPIPESLVQSLVGAAQSAATSSNLQLYSLVRIQDPERRERIAQLCGDQKQVRTAATFFAFLADTYRVRRAAERAGVDPDGLDTTEMYTVGVVDAALAAERMVCAAEGAGLGICYIGALRNQPASVAELLHLPPGVFGVFGLCLGWPAENARADVKPRLSQRAVLFDEVYNPDPDTDEYDARMATFYAEQNMPTDASWSKRSGQRSALTGLSGREQLLPWLQERGLLRR